MRKAAVEDCQSVLSHYGIDLSKGQVLDVGGTRDVWLQTGRDVIVTQNPLLSLCPQITFLDRGFNVEALGTRTDEMVDFLDGGAIKPLHDKFDVTLCFDTLEHVSDPFRFCDHLVRVTRPQGYVWLSTVFSWVYHPSPEDYYRFSPAGLRQCFLNESSPSRDPVTVVWSGWGTDEGGVSILVYKGRNKGFREPFELTPPRRPALDRAEERSVRAVRKTFEILHRAGRKLFSLTNRRPL